MADFILITLIVVFVTAAICWNFLYFIRVVPYLRKHGVAVNDFLVGMKYREYLSAYAEVCDRNGDGRQGNKIRRVIIVCQAVAFLVAVVLMFDRPLWQ